MSSRTMGSGRRLGGRDVRPVRCLRHLRLLVQFPQVESTVPFVAMPLSRVPVSMSC